MKIIVFGAAGRTGRHVVNQALSAGHTVTAFTYTNPIESTFNESDSLQIINGNARELDDVTTAISGHDAVINIIAPKLFDKNNYSISVIATENIIAAMQLLGIKRYIGQAGAWATDQLQDASIIMRIGFKLFLPLKHIYAYKKQEDEIVKNSDLNWTLVRCGILSNKIPNSQYKIFKDRYTCKWYELPTIRRCNVARFEVAIITDTSYFKACPIIIE